MNWQSIKPADVASATGVDKGNLSRFVSGKTRSGVGPEKAHTILLSLGWGSLGPVPDRVHMWRLDAVEPALWVFGELLGGRIEVGPLWNFERDDVDVSTQQELPHRGVLIARHAGAWIVLTESSQLNNHTARESPLDMLLGGNGEITIQAKTQYVASSSRAFHSIAEGQVSPSTMRLLSTKYEQQTVKLSTPSVRMLNEHLDEWLTESEFADILNDAYTRKCKSNFFDMVELFHQNYFETWKRSNHRAPSDSEVARIRRLATTTVLEIAQKPYALDWSSDIEAKQSNLP